MACCCLTSAHATERTSFPSRALLEDDDEPLNANVTSESTPTTSTDDTSYTLVYACSGTCYAGEPKPNGNETDRLTVSKTERERERDSARPRDEGLRGENVERALFAPIPRAHPPALTPLPSSVQR